MATNNAANNVTAATGKVLQGAGVGVASTFSTATYPSTATGTGKILRADGTNWAASTATFPDTAGTSGNILTSDGTNWTSAAPSSTINYVFGTLTNAQIKDLNTTPIQLIAAPGSNNFIRLISITSKMLYGGTNVFTNAGAQPISIRYGTTNTSQTLVGSATITASVTTTSLPGIAALDQIATSSLSNQIVYAWNSSATEIAGNAANNNVIFYGIYYTIVTGF